MHRGSAPHVGGQTGHIIAKRSDVFEWHLDCFTAPRTDGEVRWRGARR